MDSDSPKFGNPPVVETAIGIQFAELAEFKQSHFGWFHQLISTEYPFSEDQARLARLSENFPRTFRRGGIHLKQMTSPDRVLYRDKLDNPSMLVQVQPDRFGFNWRRESEETPYPSFAVNLAKCMSKFDLFVNFCMKHGLGEVSPDLCEVVYVNQIFPGLNESAQSLFSQLFFPESPDPFDRYLPPPSTTAFNRVYDMGDQRGRLYADASVAMHSERGDFISLRMIARAHRGSGSVAEDVQTAHAWIVNGFLTLTKPQIRRDRWKQE